jgi:ParB family transcriptional regulator, chromosome partitioning protein
MKKRTTQPYQIRGVDVLFGETEPSANADRHLPIDKIKPFKQQPRRYFDEEKLAQLVESVKQHGILEPLLVRPARDGGYLLVAGERRYRAATIAGLTEVPVVIHDFSDEEALQVALVENLQREDLNPIEETEAILELIAIRLQKSTGEVIKLLNSAAHPDRNPDAVDNVIHSQDWHILQQVFDVVGRFTPESFRTNRLPLLNLPEEVLTALREGKIAYTKARAIARVKEEDDRSTLLETAIEQDLSLSQIKEQVAAATQSKKRDSQVSNPNLKSQFERVYRQAKNSKAWDNPGKKKKIEAALQVLEQLLTEED